MNRSKFVTVDNVNQSQIANFQELISMLCQQIGTIEALISSCKGKDKLVCVDLKLSRETGDAGTYANEYKKFDSKIEDTKWDIPKIRKMIMGHNSNLGLLLALLDTDSPNQIVLFDIPYDKEKNIVFRCYSNDYVLYSLKRTIIESEVFNDFALKKIVVCCHCGERSSEPLKKCARCKKVAYCSVECQREAWKTHKSACSALDAPSTDELD